MQTELHIAALVAELRREAVGGKIESTAFYKKERAAYLYVKRNRTRNALGFLFHPTGYGLFWVPSSKIRLETREKPRSFFRLNDAIITGAMQIESDRIIQLTVDQDGKSFSVIIEALGPNGNLWLLDADDNRSSSLRRRTFNEGERYKPPPIPDKLNLFTLSVEVLKEKFGKFPVTAYNFARNVRGVDELLAREIIYRTERRVKMDAGSEDASWSILAAVIGEIAERFAGSERGYLYEINNTLHAAPFKLSSIDAIPEKFRTLSLAIMSATCRRQQRAQQTGREKQIEAALRRVVKRFERRIKGVEQDIEGAAEYEKYRRFGELLQINHGRLKRGMASITVEDVYSEYGEKIEIPLDSAVTPQKNIEVYFRRHRKGREGLALLQRRLEVSKQELSRLRSMQEEVRNNYDLASEKYAAELLALLPGTGPQRQESKRLPYRQHLLSTGVTIFVGREGADNDRTTFDFARPYELWFHAQQCAGSHVVMKFPSKSFEPSRSEIEETAAAAAWHSKARNNGLVPVIYTQRKYVRKPRGAKPGLVTVEREKSVMIEPKKPD